MNDFRALVLERDGERVRAGVRALPVDALPPGEVLVSVRYSSLNYKDGLAVTGRGKVVRADYPFVPGIDLAGTVAESGDPAFRPGDAVIVTGWGVGEERWGGYGSLARVRPEWVVPLPGGLSLHDAMAIGTAGFTAMLAVMGLEEHGLDTSAFPVVVTGASGGVGSLSVAILAQRGYRVAASTGSERAHALLRGLGAAELVDRSVLGGGAARPLDSARWAGGVDTVGAATLAALLSQVERHGSVAACGLAGGHELHTTVFPFILRGVNLLGIDSNYCPPERRLRAWDRLARDLPRAALQSLTETIPLEAVPAHSERILKGAVQGRVVVEVS